MEDWLALQQQRQQLQQQDVPDEALKLVKTRDLDHIQGAVYSHYFDVSNSSAIAVSSHGSPSVSVIFPNKDKSPLVLSTDKNYGSVAFVEKLDKEYLAAVWNGRSIHLWDMEKNTSQVVYNFESTPQKQMNFCVLDSKTVACGAVYPTDEGFHEIYILNTESKMWNLGNILIVDGVRVIYDMCYSQTIDGTSCMLLCCPHEHEVQAVELIGGRIRWKTEKQLMGVGFLPWSICADKNSTVYVVDNYLHRMHLLSAEDGSVLKTVSLFPYGIVTPSTIRVLDKDVYIAHVDKDWKKSQITKFTNLDQ